MARIFIGDVQGCRAELEELLAEAGFDDGRDRLFFVGDLINRGPDSAGVLRLARSLDAAVVLGNHEARLLEAGLFADAPPDRDRFPHCADLVGAEDRVELGEWIRTWPVAREVGDVLLVHAAAPPSLWHATRFAEPARAEREFALAARYADAGGRRPDSDWPPPGEPFRPWYEHYRGPWTVVFGHWARNGLVIEPRLRGLDTGCVYGGKLTAWIAEDDRIVQVDARRRYYG